MRLHAIVHATASGKEDRSQHGGHYPAESAHHTPLHVHCRTRYGANNSMRFAMFEAERSYRENPKDHECVFDKKAWHHLNSSQVIVGGSGTHL